MPKRAVLLLNLGSPDSTSVPDVKRYLREFLGDERVIDKPDNGFLRWILVNGIIIPFRAKNSAHAYSTIWTAEGSPLIVTSKHAHAALQKHLTAPVELAMNYGNPSIPDVLHRIAKQGIDRLLLFPQYPHYAMSSWETVVAKVHREAAKIAPDMKIECVQPYFADADYIAALVASAKPYLSQPHDHLLFSYHGIPRRHLEPKKLGRRLLQLRRQRPRRRAVQDDHVDLGPIALALLKRGTVIKPEMFSYADMPAAGMENQIITDLKLLKNMELVRDLTPNTPLRSYDVKNAVLVKRGQEVQVTAGEGQGFSITMRAEALQDGGLGEQIRLKNVESGRSLSGVITGPNAAKLR